MKKLLSIMSHLRTHYHFLYFQKGDQHTGDNWLIQCHKHRKDKYGTPL